ncbi:hypothetical protein RO3G_07013 [Lichtheimia corymbifera JMRC:FSU:9682]|uniref:HMG box domain-containing protein n=1 Tax=Lichtheimia corymbifera JMRC:FSU:9682 TaxID=1263082 RepID=A0A068S864_9FUNG|nr:hypothetical protein RO3G_07013 [Lichtheimia corymbifera JMRC:FSU:9682]
MTSFNERDAGHREVKQVLERCKLLQYLETFIAEGFDCLKSLCEISEDDLVALKVKRGHRRLLQREIATAKGIPRNQPLWIRTTGSISAAQSPISSMASPTPPGMANSSTATSTMNNPSDSSGSDSLAPSSNTTVSSGGLRSSKKGAAGQVPQSSNTSSAFGATLSSSSSSRQNKGSDSSMDDTASSSLPPPPKRRYRRHPKPDRNAPVKPPSAYVMFANDVRSKLKEQNLTFAQLAKATGERWKSLNDTERQRYETMAGEAKKIYNIALEQYKLTPEYKRYQEYLREFRLTYEPHHRHQQSSYDQQNPQKFMRSVESPGSGSLADYSSNGNSIGQVSSSSGGSADGGDEDGKRKKPASSAMTSGADDKNDAVAVRGFFQVQGDDENNNNDDDTWPDYIHDSVPSFSGQCPTTLAASDCSKARDDGRSKADAMLLDDDDDDDDIENNQNDNDKQQQQQQQQQHTATTNVVVADSTNSQLH